VTPAAPATLGRLLGRCLAAAGIERVYVASDAAVPVAGLDGEVRVILAGSAILAALLADADGRLGPAPGAALLPGPSGPLSGRPGPVLRLSSRPGGEVPVLPVDDARVLPDAVAGSAAIAGAGVPGTASLALTFDLAAPAPDGLGPAPIPAPVVPDPRERLPAEVDGEVVVLAGPGVVREGAVDALRALAARAGVGVANTWGAKGVFDWQSPHHMGTVGLQARDFDLLGWADAGLVLATGVDPDEAGADRWARAGSRAVVIGAAPGRLGDLAAAWPWPPASPRPNELYRRLAEVVQPLYRSDASPLSPGRVVADLRAALPADGLLVADPGPAGLWVARAFPTTHPGTVLVPATPAPGFAAAAALVAALRHPGTRPVAVTTAPVDDVTEEAVELAARLGVGFVLEEWGTDGVAHPGEHADALVAAQAGDGVTRLPVAVDLAQTALLVEVAGEVVAWT